jgi:hypothetical protein
MSNNSDPAERLEEIRESFTRTVTDAGWSFVEKDREEWLRVLAVSLDTYSGDWELARPRVLGLTVAVARLAIALSVKKGKTIERKALVLAAVLISGGCHGDPAEPDQPQLRGRPCENVTLEGFPADDAAAALELYKQMYKESGLPVSS